MNNNWEIMMMMMVLLSRGVSHAREFNNMHTPQRVNSWQGSRNIFYIQLYVLSDRSIWSLGIDIIHVTYPLCSAC